MRLFWIYMALISFQCSGQSNIDSWISSSIKRGNIGLKSVIQGPNDSIQKVYQFILKDDADLYNYLIERAAPFISEEILKSENVIILDSVNFKSVEIENIFRLSLAKGIQNYIDSLYQLEKYYEVKQIYDKLPIINGKALLYVQLNGLEFAELKKYEKDESLIEESFSLYQSIINSLINTGDSRSMKRLYKSSWLCQEEYFKYFKSKKLLKQYYQKFG